MMLNLNQKKMDEKELQKIIEKLNNLNQLYLPNGATGAVWLGDVIDVLNSHFNFSPKQRR